MTVSSVEHEARVPTLTETEHHKSTEHILEMPTTNLTCKGLISGFNFYFTIQMTWSKLSDNNIFYLFQTRRPLFIRADIISLTKKPTTKKEAYKKGQSN